MRCPKSRGDKSPGLRFKSPIAISKLPLSNILKRGETGCSCISDIGYRLIRRPKYERCTYRKASLAGRLYTFCCILHAKHIIPSWCGCISVLYFMIASLNCALSLYTSIIQIDTRSMFTVRDFAVYFIVHGVSRRFRYARDFSRLSLLHGVSRKLNRKTFSFPSIRIVHRILSSWCSR